MKERKCEASSTRKKIVITDERMYVVGYEHDEVLGMLVHALTDTFHGVDGPINCDVTGKKIIDLLFDARTAARVDMIYDVLFDEDGTDEEDEYEDENEDDEY